MVLFSGMATAKTNRLHPVKAQVHFLATSASIRGTWAAIWIFIWLKSFCPPEASLFWRG
jgi:hypothetical protein